MRGQRPGSQPRLFLFGNRTQRLDRVIVALAGCALAAMGAPSRSFAQTCSPSSTTLAIPAAIQSKGLADLGSFIAPHWGECWSRSNLDTQDPVWAGWPPASQDPWVHGRTESMIIATDPGGGTWYANGLVDRGFSLTPVPPSSPNYYQPFKMLLPANVPALVEYTGTFWQHQTLAWPHCSYERMKALAILNHRPIYRTTSDGRLVVGLDTQGNPIIETFELVFNRAGVIDPDDVDRGLMPPLYFIDTIDGQAPPEDGAGLATIYLTSPAPFYYGFFFIAAHVQFQGTGDSPAYDHPEMPDHTVFRDPIENCRLMGLFYSYGAIGFQGSGNVYGSLCADREFTGFGTWAVYYDGRLFDLTRNKLVAGPGFVAPSSTVVETQPELLIPILYGGDDPTSIRFEYTVGGTAKGGGIDYTLAPGSLVIDPGVSFLTIPLGIVDDPDFELPETIVIEVRKPNCLDSPPIATHTVTILSDDALQPASTGCMIH